MKILYQIAYLDGYGDDRFIYDGMRRAFEKRGHIVQPLTERDNLLEALTSFNPDIFITAMDVSYFDWKDVAVTLKGYRSRGLRVFMRGPNFQVHADLADLARNDMLADVYYSEVPIPREAIDDIAGQPCHMLPLAADPLVHFPTRPSNKYKCDIIYIGANLPRKREIFERRLFPLMKKYNVKIFGGDWDFADHYVLHPLAKIDRRLNLGGIFSRMRISRQVPITEENVAYSSAKIALNFHEQNTTIGPNGRIFRIPASGGFEICDPVPELRDYFSEDEMPMPLDDKSFFETVDYYLLHEKERKAMQERATTRALRDHTWDNRIQDMLKWYNQSHIT